MPGFATPCSRRSYGHGARISGAVSILLAVVCPAARAQDNYEIQVYGSETVPPNHTMVELHSNFTIDGSKDLIDGFYPTEHALHETVEITQGWTDWFETGFYIFTSENRGYGWQWVGDHIRPRVRVPPSWNWPVGVSLSLEVGYQRAHYSPDTWTLEIRPIVDKQVGRWYLSFNPTLDRSFHGPGVAEGVGFSPNFKAGYDITKRLNMGIEYYGELGPVTGFDPLRDQEQQIVPALDLNLAPNWEFNFGVGVGVTQNTDHLLVKMILGRRFNVPW
jgi:Putative MetA-pathway of phenol degradation